MPPQPIPAYKKTEEVIEALREGIGELHRLADEERAKHTPNEERGTQLDFCEGCLIDLRSSLCVAYDPAGVGKGINSGCSNPHMPSA